METAAALPSGIAQPRYDRAAQKCGLVHFGIGAFHRAHQAVYFDDAMNAGERDWAITGVSMRSTSVTEQLNPQNGLFTLAIRSGERTDHRLIGSVREVLVASAQRAAVGAAIASADTRIITFTVTEKGYCRAPDGSLDHALAHEGSIYGLLADGLALRRAAGHPGVTLLSCDNLAHNGQQLERLLLSHLETQHAALADWVRAQCTFPSSMVDRIVPATTPADLDRAAAVLGLRDEGHVGTESFSQWVIEDRFAGPRPRFADYGVELVQDVTPYETAKLRMLNGAHSLLAYAGLARGHGFVHQAIADPAIHPLVRRLMQDEAAPSITPAAGQDLAAYADSLIARFANQAINHRLSQIAMDGSQKIPQRWLETLAWNQQQGRQCPAILAGLGGWLLHIGGANGPVEDPLAQDLAAAWSIHGKGGVVQAIFGPDGLLASQWQPSRADQDLVVRTMDGLRGA